MGRIERGCIIRLGRVGSKWRLENADTVPRTLAGMNAGSAEPRVRSRSTLGGGIVQGTPSGDGAGGEGRAGSLGGCIRRSEWCDRGSPVDGVRFAVKPGRWQTGKSAMFPDPCFLLFPCESRRR